MRNNIKIKYIERMKFVNKSTDIKHEDMIMKKAMDTFA